MIIKYRNIKSGCVRGMECMFLHNRNYIKIVAKYFKQKCDACNFDSDKDKVKINNIQEQRCILLHNCDKIIKHKEVLEKKKN